MPQKYALIGGTPQPFLHWTAICVNTAAAAAGDPAAGVVPGRANDADARQELHTVELTGTIRPIRFPDQQQRRSSARGILELLMCACMVFACGYQRDFGAQAEDPAKAVSWEMQYQALSKV